MYGSNESAGRTVTPLVRPYVITGGRTHARRELGPAVVVRTAPAPGWFVGLRPEAREILRLCRTPLTLGEIAAALGIPVGVVDVLVDDLSTYGLITVDRRRLAVATATAVASHRAELTAA